MCVDMCVCAHIIMCACMCMPVCVHIYVCMLCMCVCVCVFIIKCMCMYICTRVCACLDAHTRERDTIAKVINSQHIDILVLIYVATEGDHDYFSSS